MRITSVNWLHAPPLPPCFLNSGAPSSRTREEHISSTLLGKDDGLIRCPMIIRLGIEFKGRDPVRTLDALLASKGFSAAEELRASFNIPMKRLIARADTKHQPLAISSANATAILQQALMLGLCTAMLYDPARPVLWTTASLARRLELFDPEGFYA